LVERFTQTGRQGDPNPTVGRLGGDEFLVLLPNVGNIDQALMVSGRLIAGLAHPIALDGHSTYCHASMGIALYPTHGATAEILIRNADSAMYTAKRVRGSSVAVYDQEISNATIRNMRLLSDLHVAMVDKEFILYFQPIFNIASNRIRTVEALLRWQHPELGLISPVEFIPLLEQTGLIVDVGAWVLRKACHQLKRWKQSGSPIEHVTINASVVQLSQSDFSSIAIEIAKEEGIEPESITIEITESVLMENPQKHIAQLQKLRDAGMQVALDDFGTGHSSLDYLQQLPVSILKIDRSLVSNNGRKAGRAILFVLCELARRMEIQCIAEGVETADEYRDLIEAGCDSIQGWIIGKPLPADQADNLARTFDSEVIFAREELPSAPCNNELVLPHGNRHSA
jgi:predicted signal transduction protein with EAL and GGDEF domain